MVVNDGASHSVDSNEMAFRLCSLYAFREGFKNANPIIMEPLMDVEVVAPTEFQGLVLGGINKRKGVIESTEACKFTISKNLSCTAEDYVSIHAEVPLNNMFGYSTDLRSATQA